MKTVFLFLCLVSSTFSFSQKKEILGISQFDRISISPKINVVLIKGDKESVTLEYAGIEYNKINVEVVNNKLRIYLDNARLLDKRQYVNDDYNSKESVYKNANITAYITFQELRSLEIRGEEKVICQDDIQGDKFKLVAYGESEIILKSVHARKFKAAVYGENTVRITGGDTKHQVFRLFGENEIDSKNMETTTATARIYGDGNLQVKTLDELYLVAIGEPTVHMIGQGNVNKGIVIGRVNIERELIEK